MSDRDDLHFCSHCGMDIEKNEVCETCGLPGCRYCYRLFVVIGWGGFSHSSSS